MDAILEDFSESMKRTFSKSHNCYILEFVDCLNRNFVVEGSFDKVLDRFKDEDFAILSAYCSTTSREKNIECNHNIKNTFDENQIGVYKLVGHWLGDESANNNDVVNAIDTAFLVARPHNMPFRTFKKIVVETLKIEEYTPNVALAYRAEYHTYYSFNSAGRTAEIGVGWRANEVSQSYAMYVKRCDKPFTFDGCLQPSTNFGKQLYEMKKYKY